MIRLTDEEIQDAVGKVMVDKGLSQIAKEDITRDSIVATAQLKKVVRGLRQYEAYHQEDGRTKIGCHIPPCDWQALLEEVKE